MDRITAKHKAVFDSPEIADGTALYHAMSYLGSVKDVFGTGDSDASVVVVLRHAAVPMLFNDAMWAKYNIGKESKIKDGKDWAVRNPYLTSTRGAGREDRPSATITWLASHGHILLGCNAATLGFASGYAQTAGVDEKVVYEDLKANLVPGMILQPNGIYAVHRAQEAGCTFFKSS